MKTIRTNCFETNSSSTHSFTVSAPKDLTLKPAQTFLTEDGIVRVQLNAGEPSDSLLGKLTFLLTASYFIGDQAAFDRVVKVTEDFAKVKLEITAREWNKKEWATTAVTKVKDYGTQATNTEDEDEDFDDDSEHPAAETINDEFCSWVNEYGHENADDFINEVSEITATEQGILVFVFSNIQPFATESYYS